MEFELDTGNTAWLITASSLVLLMTPGLAFFYGGMVRGKSVLNMMMMSFASIGVAGLIWVVYGYGLAFGPDLGGFIGNPTGLIGLAVDNAASPMTAFGIPALVVRRLPGDVRDHHRRPHLRRYRRPRQVRHLDRLQRHLGHHRLHAAGPLGLGRRHVRCRRLARLGALAADRLRRWHRGAHQRRCRRTGRWPS